MASGDALSGAVAAPAGEDVVPAAVSPEDDVCYTIDGVASTKLRRLQGVDSRALPASYSSVSAKEELCLEYVDNFRTQFTELFPDRRELYLTPKNECGVPKFVCTSLTPTLLPFPSLYDLRHVAAFVSRAMLYEPLEHPTKPPQFLPSPSTVLSWQTGDSFDFALVLTSFLIGDGYDALVVYGNAPRSITLRDQTRTPLPFTIRDENFKLDDAITAAMEAEDAALAAAHAAVVAAQTVTTAAGAPSATSTLPASSAAAVGGDAVVEESKGDGDVVGGGGGDSGSIVDGGGTATKPVEVSGGAGGSRYHVSEKGPPQSLFVKAMEEKAAAAAATATSVPVLEEEGAPEPDDPLAGRRVHAWVLVRAGKRGVEEHLFVEPTTGRMYPVHRSPYVAVEAVWNHRNYWVNMQSAGMDSMSYELHDGDAWEYVFIVPRQTKNGGVVSPKDAGGDELGLGPDDGDGDAHAGRAADGKGGESGAAPAADDSGDHILDLPPSWTSPVALDGDVVARRYGANGYCHTLYRKAKLVLFAPHVHPTGLVAEVSEFRDLGRTEVTRVVELFEARRDKLLKRVRSPVLRRVDEFFAPGRPSSLRRLTEIAGRRREFEFYPSRIDGLLRREEDVGRKFIEHFGDTDDKLFYRSVTFAGDDDRNGEDDHRRGGGRRSRGGATGGPASGGGARPKGGKALQSTLTVEGLGELQVRKVTEKFRRNPSIPAERDVARRTYLVLEKVIKEEYHYEAGRVTRSTRTYNKEGEQNVEHSTMNPFAATPKASDLSADFNAVIAKERACFEAVKASLDNANEILKLRRTDEKAVELERSVFEIALERSRAGGPRRSEKETKDEGAEGKMDYLTPFLQNALNPAKLTREEAARADQQCRKAFRARLIERVNIIQRRLDEENEKLQKKQQAFQRNREHVEGADEEFEKYCAEAMFRIGILEQRLQRQEETVLAKYAELEAKLRCDERLAVLYQADEAATKGRK